MAELTIRKHDDQTAPATVAPARRAQRLMQRLLRWDPFGQMLPIVPSIPEGFAPSFEIRETKDAFVFEADVPGVKEKDLDVSVSGDRLTISGKREAKEETRTETFYACERSYGEFSRSFTLPEGADTSSIRAGLDGGVLTVTVRKSAELQPKKIAIHSK
jgi:HSP20 family protein